jgi:hypothetical protein
VDRRSVPWSDRYAAGDGLGIAGGVALGPDAQEAMSKIGLEYDSMIWTVGWPERPFDAASGSRRSRRQWDDEALAFDDWPATENDGLLFPGDHDGCQCVAMPLSRAVDRRGPSRRMVPMLTIRQTENGWELVRDGQVLTIDVEGTDVDVRPVRGRRRCPGDDDRTPRSAAMGDGTEVEGET